MKLSFLLLRSREDTYTIAHQTQWRTIFLLGNVILVLTLLVIGSNLFTKVEQMGFRRPGSTSTGSVVVQQIAGPPVHIVTNISSTQALLATGTPTNVPTPLVSPTPPQNPNNPYVTPTDPPDPTNTPFPLLITTVDGSFFYNPDNNSENFNVTTATPPAFVEQFPVVAFNPRSDVALGCPHTVNDNTRPFTDVIPGTPGTPCAEQPAQFPWPGTPSLQAGVGPLQRFHAIFTGQFYATESGDVTFNFWSDDGWILNIGPKVNGNGEQPSYVGGSFYPPTPGVGTPWPTGPFTQYRAVGRYDHDTGTVLTSVTVNFPASGYYPFELDYSECCDGQLALLMGTTAGNFIPPGPSATPTITATPTCSAATPFAYPWCGPISPTATAAPPAPLYTKSFYVKATATPGNATPTPQGTPGIWWTAGYTAADLAISDARPHRGLVIFDFGQPDYTYDCPLIRCVQVWGTDLIDREAGYPFITINEIKSVVSDFAQGFYKRASSVAPGVDPPQVVLAVGTSNYWSPTSNTPLTADDFYKHGRQWGNMVNSLGTDYIGLAPVVTFEGANDIEFAWSPADYALKWAQGFDEVTRGTSCTNCLSHRYYAYASCDDCYPDDPDPNASIRRNPHPEATFIVPPAPSPTPIPWHMDEIVGAVWANRAALPLPQIYYGLPVRSPDQPAEWQWLSSYAATHSICLDQYGLTRGIPGRMSFQGVMADPSSLAPATAWQFLWQALTREVCTVPGIQPSGSVLYSTQIIDFPIR